MKTSELTGAALDWAVATCEGKRLHYFVDDWFKKDPWLTLDGIVDLPLHAFTPSTAWSQGGPIIEREEISVERRMPCMKDEQWGAQGWKAMQNFHKGPTPLIAAMRCYVASKLGDDVEIPEELTS